MTFLPIHFERNQVYFGKCYCMDSEMSDLLPPWPLFSAFLFASLVLALTPGPGVLYIVSRSLAQGCRVGLLSVAGIALGNLGNVFAASIGLASMFEVSSAAFAVIKYAGGFYLIYLGVRMLRSSSGREAITLPTAAAPISGHVFRDGLVVALLNPKTTVFFAAFLPQFISPGASALLQGLILGALFVAIASVTDIFYALATGMVSPSLRTGRGQRFCLQTSGGVFIGLGVFAALAGSRAAPINW